MLGQVLEASGDRGEVAVVLKQSLETFEEIQSLPGLGQTLLAYGQFKLGDDAAEGQRLIARAHSIFARIGAVDWVAEATAPAAPRWRFQAVEHLEGQLVAQRAAASQPAASWSSRAFDAAACFERAIGLARGRELRSLEPPAWQWQGLTVPEPMLGVAVGARRRGRR